MTHIKITAQAWLDDKRIDDKRTDKRRSGGRRSAELSTLDGTVELSIPVDLGALGHTMTVQFPLSALMRLNRS